MIETDAPAIFMYNSQLDFQIFKPKKTFGNARNQMKVAFGITNLYICTNGISESKMKHWTIFSLFFLPLHCHSFFSLLFHIYISDHKLRRKQKNQNGTRELVAREMVCNQNGIKCCTIQKSSGSTRSSAVSVFLAEQCATTAREE